MKKLSILLIVLLSTMLLFNTNTVKANEICDDNGICITLENNPVITVLSNIPKTIYSNDNTDWLQYATAYDQQDGDITSNIQYTHNINYMKDGRYWIKYYVYDSDNNYTQTYAYVNLYVVQGA